MALQAEERVELRQMLVSAIGEKGAEILLSQFPARDLDEPVTKDFVRAEVTATRGDLRGEIALTRSELRTEISATRSDLQAEIAATRSDLQAEIAATRSDLQAEIGGVRTGLAKLEARTERLIRGQTRWIVATLVAIGGVLVASNWLS